MNEVVSTTDNSTPLQPITLLQPENHNKRYESLFVEIDTGQIKLPRFQREFVWDKEQSGRLIDSILKGFPIGTFIFWRTKEDLRSYKEVGNHKLPETPKGEYVQYILDGQQRITSLYAIRKGIRITKDGKEIDYRDIYINLDYNPESDEQIVTTEQVEGLLYVSVHDVLSKPLGSFYKTLTHAQADQVEQYKSKLTNYDFSTITIKDYPLDVACEVFSRINTGGKALTVFEIMVAKTYDEAKGFDLAERYEILRDGSDDEKECLQTANFDTVPESTIMQCVAAIALRALRSRDILKIKRDTFIETWDAMKASLFMAIDFVRTELRVPVSQLLPYSAVLVPFTYFFHSIGNRKPTHAQGRLLEQFYYWAGLTMRYGSATESKVAEDFNKMDAIVKETMPTYPSNEVKVDADVISQTWFSAGNAYCKAILCLLAYQGPKSFDTNGIVLLDNSNLKIATSRNYHHFFPRNYLSNEDPDKQANLIANITLIDGYSNKHRIGKKAPSDYIEKFAKTNKHLRETLATHLILDSERYGVFDDDYVTFIKYRSRAIANALNVKLHSLTADEAEAIEELPLS